MVTTVPNVTSVTNNLMNNIKFILETYHGINSRYQCPECKRKEKTFSRYINTHTGEHIHETVGRCNRESNCGYHYTPKQYFQDNKILSEVSRNDYPKANPSPKANPNPKPMANPNNVSYINIANFKATLKSYEVNHFVSFLVSVFGYKTTNELISKYFIGSSKHWQGATIFWQIDSQGNIRTGKIMLYSAETGKRIKEPFPHITWVHKTIQQPKFELRQCLFGEHLLIDKTKPVAIVESEKTAIIASAYLPSFIWLASGSLNNLNINTCKDLAGRRVSLFPDLKCFEKWSAKAKELANYAHFNVSDLLERRATEDERAKGLDLADYLLKFNYRDLVLNVPEEPQTQTEEPPVYLPVVKPKHISPSKLIYDFEIPELIQQENWLSELDELEKFFSGVAFSNEPIKLNQCTTITDISLFLETNFATARANKGKPTFLPYLNRIKELMIVFIDTSI